VGGQPCIRGMMITVRRVVGLLAEHDDRGGLLKDYPDLEPDDLRQALHFAASSLNGGIDFHIHAA
jgi:uncharacterized protein (DUF433 family)